MVTLAGSIYHMLKTKIEKFSKWKSIPKKPKYVIFFKSEFSMVLSVGVDNTHTNNKNPKIFQKIPEVLMKIQKYSKRKIGTKKQKMIILQKKCLTWIWHGYYSRNWNLICEKVNIKKISKIQKRSNKNDNDFKMYFPWLF